MNDEVSYTNTPDEINSSKAIIKSIDSLIDKYLGKVDKLGSVKAIIS